MAKNRLFTLAVVIVALLGNALITPATSFADAGTNPIPGNACVFQDPALSGSVADFVYMDPDWPSYYQRDPVYPGFHFKGSQWAGLDIVQTQLRLPFATGGTVIANTGGSYDPAGGGYGVAYEGNGNCAGWVSGYWHNPSPVGYSVGQPLDANTPASTPGCSGFDSVCGENPGQIRPHTHWSVGFRSAEDPFPADIPAYHTVSGNPTIGSVWWINPLRLMPKVTDQQVATIWYAASHQSSVTTPATQPASPITTILIGVIFTALILLAATGRKVKTTLGLTITGVIWLLITITATPAVKQVARTTTWYGTKSAQTVWYRPKPLGTPTKRPPVLASRKKAPPMARAGR